MKSIWNKTVCLNSFPALNSDVSTEVLVIGGGITGLLCAYMLQQAGVPYILTEASHICSGTTGYTTAKITSQHGLIYHKLNKKHGSEKTRMYLDAQQNALNTYKKLCTENECHFSVCDNYVYATNTGHKLEKEWNTLQTLGFNAAYVKELPLPLSVTGSIMFPKQAQFHPLMFINSISKNLNIYEHTAVKSIDNNIGYTDHGKIKASHIIIATHFPFINRHGMYFLKLYQHRSYVLALENPDTPTRLQVGGMYVDEDSAGLSFRNEGNLLLLGGGAHRTGQKGGNWSVLREFADQHYPGSICRYRYAAQDCMPPDALPYIGNYSSRTRNLYVATGFQKWGMTNAMVAATLLRDKIIGEKNPYEELFSPSRSVLQPQIAANALHATINLLTPTIRRCPHLGCALKWNPAEHSWDCPCHGSRFTENGKLIDNPAAGDLPYSK